jgi:hypothetical protein
MHPVSYRVLADLLLAFHVLFVLFVVIGLLLILLGGVRGWAWVRNPWFRLGHLAAITFVAAQAWLGEICPLTTWEMNLRDRAGEATYAGGFLEHWLQALLYYEAPSWAFTTAYSGFALLVAGSWIGVRPRPIR